MKVQRTTKKYFKQSDTFQEYWNRVLKNLNRLQRNKRVAENLRAARIQISKDRKGIQSILAPLWAD